jgi:hypothetical protein
MRRREPEPECHIDWVGVYDVLYVLLVLESSYLVYTTNDEQKVSHFVPTSDAEPLFLELLLYALCFAPVRWYRY